MKNNIIKKFRYVDHVFAEMAIYIPRKLRAKVETELGIVNFFTSTLEVLDRTIEEEIDID